MAEWKCTCGERPVHDDQRQCAANRQATAQMMGRQHQQKLMEVRDAAGKFVRFPIEDEWWLAAGTEVPGGRIYKP